MRKLYEEYDKKGFNGTDNKTGSISLDGASLFRSYRWSFTNALYSSLISA